MKLFSLSFLLMTILPVLATEQRLYLGTYTQKEGSVGIYQSSLDLKTGALSQPTLAIHTGNPTYLALHPNGRVLYSVDENGKDANGRPTGFVSGFAVDRDTGGLTLLNTQPVADGGPGPCHLVVDTSGQVLLVANYGGGSVAAFPLSPDGQIGSRSALEVHTGPLGPRTKRQDAPHAHCVTLAPDRSRVYVADLGLDRIYAYGIDSSHGTLTPLEPAFTTMKPGSGPRHIVFSREGRFSYVVNELGSSVALLERDSATNMLVTRQTVSALPDDYHGENTAAEIRLHPNGRFLYVSNRGQDSLAVFVRDLDSGRLTPVEIVPCGGKGPRDFALSSDGAWLVCAHQLSHSISVFAVDASTGKLSLTGPSVALHSPVCVLFAPALKSD